MKNGIKILVVDDSAFMRLLLSDLLNNDEELEVVGTASDGQEAVSQVKLLNPDLVLLDIHMGEYDGLYAVEQIMHNSPKPILILSSIGNTNLNPIFDALRLGAVDYINKPKKGGSKIREMEKELIQKIKKVASASPRSTKIVEKGINQLTHTFDPKPNYDIIAIGASTGGPSAIEKIVTSLPANLNVPVIIGQHMPQNFIPSFAKRLDGLTKLKVTVGSKGMEVRSGMIVVAPGDGNMIVQKEKGTGIIDFSNKKYREYNHPSINALLNSVAEKYGKRAIGVLLTGMGKDGVNGLKAIKEKGGITIAQDESSSIIYGMPKMAFENGAADVVLNIKEIGGYLVNCL
ncbi:chemotaxis-specific protein-glutamate methyltransferase CheB [Marinoscillum sp. MHG1-6]|uniref:chemotaxis-specific protein-glutamate methyltransferase CheB n=1 Tax=Marinoscillum sp. MHG1-6 TaxID=2959627 RepID=UPI0021585EFB|nr:chemotaxis-specific protein-glutamate methyltransferase CheB [Marinoscillum sp. MHG1-6]